jgi:hypothetical protein
MAGVLHIVRKDVRRLRWLLVLWVAVLGVRLAFATAATRITSDTVGPAFALEGLGGIVGTLETLLLALLVARLVHEEPLVGLNAFWLTRPYSPVSLLSAKLLFASIALVLLPVVADLMTMSLFDAGPSAQLRASSVFLSSRLIWMLALFALAALTPSLGGFAIAMISIVAALSLAIAVIIGMTAFSIDEFDTYLPDMTPDRTPAIVGVVVFAAAVLSVIVYQYRRRRLAVAIAMAAAGLVATVVVPAYWPWPFARSAPIEPGPWTAEPSTAAVVDRSMPMQISDAREFNGEGTPRRYVHARVQLNGMPADTFTRTIGVRGMLTLGDGTVVRSRQANGFVPLEMRGRAGFEPSVPLGALGNVDVLTRLDETAYQPWAALLTLTEDEYVTYRGQRGRFQAEVDFRLMQTRIRGTLPLVTGAALEDAASRVELVRVDRRIDAQAIAVRRWQAGSLLDEDRSGEFEFVLRNRARREVLTATRRGQRSGFGGGGSVFTGSASIPLALLTGGSAGPPSDGFLVQIDVLEFPMAVMPKGETIQLDPGWLNEAEVVVLESSYAGTVTKPLTIEDFVIPN